MTRARMMKISRLIAITLIVFLASSIVRPLIDLKLNLAGLPNAYVGWNGMMWEAGSLIGSVALLPFL